MSKTTTEQPEAMRCALCDHRLDDEQTESPYTDDGGDPICDSCYSDQYEGTCDRCENTVEKTELEMRPGELTAFWKDVDGLKPGYYRVLRWPIYMDGMVCGYVIKGNLEFVAPLDEKGTKAAKRASTPGGRMCEACREEIEKTK